MFRQNSESTETFRFGGQTETGSEMKLKTLSWMPFHIMMVVEFMMSVDIKA